jgi:hypothetical protein
MVTLRIEEGRDNPTLVTPVLSIVMLFTPDVMEIPVPAEI